MAHAKLCGRIQALIQAIHIRLPFKQLDVAMSVERLTGAGLGRDVRKPMAIRFAHETVFLPRLQICIVG